MIARWFIEGGFMMYVVLLVGVNAVAISVFHAVLVRKWSLIVSAACVIAMLLAGAAGTAIAKQRVEAAIAMVDPSMRAQLEEVGNREASRPIELAGILAVLPAIMIVTGEIRRQSARAS